MSKDWTKIRAKVKDFIENEIYPKETELAKGTPESREMLGSLMQLAKDEKIWALGHPTDIGGGGMPFMEYVYVNEVIGRSSFAMVALGTHSLQDSIMLREFASPHWRDQYLEPLVQGEIFPSFGMTEPEVASSDPTQLQTTAILEDGVWRINGRKWFTTGAARAAYTTVMCRTELEAPSHGAFSMIIVPTDNPGYKIVRETPVLGINGGHYEVKYDNVEVPEENLLGPRGQGFIIAQKRLGPGRIHHCMRAIGVGERALELMCTRGIDPNKNAFGKSLAQLGGNFDHIANSRIELNAARLLTLDAAHKMDTVGNKVAASEIAQIKVMVPNIVLDIIDRAIQIHGGEGVSQLTPLASMFAHMRTLRLADGPDEVHRRAVARHELGKHIIK